MLQDPRLDDLGMQAVSLAEVQRTGWAWPHSFGVHVRAGPDYDDTEDLVNAAVVQCRIVEPDVMTLRDWALSCLGIRDHHDAKDLTDGWSPGIGREKSHTNRLQLRLSLYYHPQENTQAGSVPGGNRREHAHGLMMTAFLQVVI